MFMLYIYVYIISTSCARLIKIDQYFRPWHSSFRCRWYRGFINYTRLMCRAIRAKYIVEYTITFVKKSRRHSVDPIIRVRSK